MNGLKQAIGEIYHRDAHYSVQNIVTYIVFLNLHILIYLFVHTHDYLLLFDKASNRILFLLFTQETNDKFVRISWTISGAVTLAVEDDIYREYELIRYH